METKKSESEVPADPIEERASEIRTTARFERSYRSKRVNARLARIAFGAALVYFTFKYALPVANRFMATPFSRLTPGDLLFGVVAPLILLVGAVAWGYYIAFGPPLIGPGDRDAHAREMARQQMTEVARERSKKRQSEWLMKQARKIGLLVAKRNRQRKND